jgi:CRISPR-associated endonuclease Csn1
MAKILGIDLGTNSLGWSVINKETNEIIDCGSRIFPEGVNKVNGKETPKNFERRLARGARKNNFRYKLRRNRLNQILASLNMKPSEEYFTSTKNTNYDKDGKKIKKYAAKDLYALRTKALNEIISLNEIGRIFNHFNSHRGFKSNAKEKAIIEFSDDDNKKKQQGKVETSAKNLERKINEAKEKGHINHGTIGEYFYYLIEQNSDSYNPNAPIENIRNSDADEEFGHYILREMYEKEFDIIWEQQSKFHDNSKIFNVENKKRIKDETIFYQRDLRSSKHLVGRCPFEFTTYKKQVRDENGEIKTIVEKSYLKCAPKSSFLFQEFRIWDKINNLQYQDNNDDWHELTIEQKRILASNLEQTENLYLNKPDKRYKFDNPQLRKNAEKQVEELKLQLSLSNNIIFNIPKLTGNRTVVSLISALEKINWERINEPMREEKISHVDIDTGEIINLPSPIKYSKTQETLWHLIYFSSQFTNSQNWLLGKEKKENNKIITTYKELRLSSTQIKNLSCVLFEPDYASYSSKAISKLLPFLKNGDDLYTAEQKAYSKSNSDKRTNDNNLLSKIPLLPNNYLKNPIVQQGANETIRLINSIIDNKDIGKPDEIRIEFTRELKKPKKIREEQKRRNDEKDSLREIFAKFLTQKLNTHISKGDSRVDKFELWLELSWCKQAFEDIKTEISLKDFTQFCKNIDDDKIKDYQKKYELWLECGRILPYEPTKTISLSELFSSEIEIEHIIPYSRCFDNSFANKTLSNKRFNNAKGNKTPIEYFESRPKSEYTQFVRNIKKLPKSKQKRLLMLTKEVDSDFKNSQLNNTAYSTTLIAEQLRKTFKFDQIKITNGAVTSTIRKIFGFETILNPPERVTGYEDGRYWAIYDENNKLYTLIKWENDEKPEIQEGHSVLRGFVKKEKLRVGKTRNDHRHHTVDAITIAFTNQRMIQFIGTITEGYYIKDGRKIKDYDEGAEFISAFDEFGNFTKDIWDSIREEAKKHFNIRGIRENAVEKISNLLISHKSENKLTSSGRKKIYKPNGKSLIIKNKVGEDINFYSGGNVARGKLHEATLYGKIYYNQPTDDNKKEWAERGSIFVHRVDLKYSKQGYFSSEKQLEKIVDPVIRKLCIDATKEKGLKKALEEGIFLPNRPLELKTKTIRKQESAKNKGINLNIPFDPPNLKREPVKVKSVRITSDSKDLTVIRSFKEQKKDYKKAYVETGDNYCIAIYGDWEANNREFVSVTFLKAAKITTENKLLALQNLPEAQFYPKTKNQLPFLMTLSKGDLVLVYDKHPDEVNDETNPEILFKRLFKVIKSDKNGLIILGRHNLSNIKADKDKPVTNINELDGSVIRKQYSTIKAIKVKINSLGKIER